MNSSACSPFSSRACTARRSVGETHRPASSCSARMSMAVIAGSTASPNREVSSSRRYFPASAFAQVSSDGVAEASTTCAPRIEARSTAMSRAL